MFGLSWVKLIGYGAALAAILGALGLLHHSIYASGEQAGAAKVQVKLDAASEQIAALQQAAQVNATSLNTCKAQNTDWASRFAKGIRNAADIAKAEHDEAVRSENALAALKAKYAGVKAWADTKLPDAVHAQGVEADK